MRTAPALALLIAALAATPARAAEATPPPTPREEVISDISTREISIQSNFTGIEILIFGSVDFSGAVEPEKEIYDVIVVLRSPDQPIVVRRKERVAGIWVNGTGKVYPNVPGFYAALSSRPLRAITSDETLKTLGIGLDCRARWRPSPQRRLRPPARMVVHRGRALDRRRAGRRGRPAGVMGGGRADRVPGRDARLSGPGPRPLALTRVHDRRRAHGRALPALHHPRAGRVDPDHRRELRRAATDRPRPSAAFAGGLRRQRRVLVDVLRPRRGGRAGGDLRRGRSRPPRL